MQFRTVKKIHPKAVVDVFRGSEKGGGGSEVVLPGVANDLPGANYCGGSNLFYAPLSHGAYQFVIINFELLYKLMFWVMLVEN